MTVNDTPSYSSSLLFSSPICNNLTHYCLRFGLFELYRSAFLHPAVTCHLFHREHEKCLHLSGLFHASKMLSISHLTGGIPEVQVCFRLLLLSAFVVDLEGDVRTWLSPDCRQGWQISLTRSYAQKYGL